MTQSLVLASTGVLPGQTAQNRLYTVFNPPVDSEWTLTVNAGEFWIVTAMRAGFAADANVSNRTVDFLYATNAALWLALDAGVTITAGVTQGFNAAIGIAQFTAGIVTQLQLPNVVLQGGSTLSSSTSGMQAGDQWSALVFNVIAYS